MLDLINPLRTNFFSLHKKIIYWVLNSFLAFIGMGKQHIYLSGFYWIFFETGSECPIGPMSSYIERGHDSRESSWSLKG